MRISARRAVCRLLLCLPLVVGCKEGGPRPGQKPRPRADVPPPKELVASLTLRSPRRMLDRSLAHLRAFIPTPLQADLLVGSLLQRVGLPAKLRDALDLDGTLRFFFLDAKGLKQRDPMIALLPLRSPRAFRQALKHAFVPAEKGSTAALQLYVPKPGSGVGPFLVRIDGQEVILPASKESYRLLAPFLAGRRARAPAVHDLTLRLEVPQLSKRQKKALGRALDLLKKGSKPGSKARPRLTSAIGRFSRKSSDLLRSAAVLELSADVDEAGVSLGLRARARTGGLLHRALAKQPREPLFALDLLPRRPAFFWASRGPGLVEVESPLEVGFETFAGEMAAAERARFKKALAMARKQLGDALTFALHLAGPGPQGAEGHWMLTWLAELKDIAAAGRALKRLTELALEWANQKARRAGKKAAATIKSQRIELAGARGSFFAISETGAAPPKRGAERAPPAGPLMLGWVIKGRVAAFAVGRDLEPYLRAIAGRIGAQDGHALAPPLQALRQREDRTGAIYFSLVETARLLEASGVATLAGVAAKMPDEEPTMGPLLAWGVDAARARLEIDLRLSRAHFLPFKGVMAALLRSFAGGRPSASNAGGSK